MSADRQIKKKIPKKSESQDIYISSRTGYDGFKDLDKYGIGRQGLLQYHCSFQSIHFDVPGGCVAVHAECSAGLLCLLYHPVGGLRFIRMFADP